MIPEGSTWLDAVNVGSSILLTVLLVILYYQQYKTQKQQSEIQKDQEKWMEAENKPFINVKNSEIFVENGLLLVELELKNEGNGPALNIQCFQKAYVTPIDFSPVFGPGRVMDIDGLLGVNELPSIKMNGEPPDAVSVKPIFFPLSDNMKTKSESGITLHKGESENVIGVIGHQMKYISFDEFSVSRYTSLQDLLKILEPTRLSQVSLETYIRYEDMVDNVKDKCIADGIIDVETPSFEEYSADITAAPTHGGSDKDINIEQKELSTPFITTPKTNRLKYSLHNESLPSIPKNYIVYHMNKNTGH